MIRYFLLLIEMVSLFTKTILLYFQIIFLLNTLIRFQISWKILYFSNFDYFFHAFFLLFSASSWWVIVAFFKLNWKYSFLQVVWPSLYLFHIESLVKDISSFSLDKNLWHFFWYILLLLRIFWPLCNINKKIKQVSVYINLLNSSQHLINLNWGLIILMTKVNLK